MVTTCRYILPEKLRKLVINEFFSFFALLFVLNSGSCSLLIKNLFLARAGWHESVVVIPDFCSRGFPMKRACLLSIYTESNCAVLMTELVFERSRSSLNVIWNKYLDETHRRSLRRSVIQRLHRIFANSYLFSLHKPRFCYVMIGRNLDWNWAKSKTSVSFIRIENPHLIICLFSTESLIASQHDVTKSLKDYLRTLKLNVVWRPNLEVMEWRQKGH